MRRPSRAYLSWGLCLLSIMWHPVFAEIQITRIGACDWTCADQDFTQLSCHQRLDKAVESCANRALADGKTYHIHSAQYQITSTEQPAETSVTLTWTPPTQNEDGSELTDLAGYRLYFAETMVEIEPEADSHQLTLPAGYYEFVITSFNTSGAESLPSNTATKTVE